ncbi:FAD-binding oxidoreductase [Aeromicrobium endophyticum]|uniref:FAD-binding oxidoreductase n=1 Tax=Aeromicrobium endophyticum TaxID=2292704 RepID=UPI0018F5F38F|nr:FAD-linked oxidase C-terminal domain-containing protein [Aeromicrobium endophyticum]
MTRDLSSLTDELADWSTAADRLAEVATDRSGSPDAGAPDLVVRARSVAEVQTVARFATAHGIALVTRGGGSGLAGGAVAGTGSIVLDLSGLDRIVELRPADHVAIVEPGVITADLDAAAAAHGLFYAPDPGSVAISTIGGNIATNAGGLRGAKYGVTRDAVLALDVVLADGRLVHLGAGTLKDVAGYDLMSLVVGSEGTPGIVVGATLRLRPRPAVTATIAAYFASLELAAEAAVAVRSTGVQPSVLEIVDGATLGAIDRLAGSHLHERGEAFLLAQVDGTDVTAEVAVVEKALVGATEVRSSTDPAVSAELLAARRLALPAIEATGRALIEDIAVPPSRLAEAVRRVHAVAEATGTTIYVFAHAGDGNLHPIIVVDAEPGAALPAAAVDAADRLFALALELGGSVTGEHGVGLLKQRWVARQVGPDVDGLHHAIKRVLDPAGILNPGKAV